MKPCPAPRDPSSRSPAVPGFEKLSSQDMFRADTVPADCISPRKDLQFIHLRRKQDISSDNQLLHPASPFPRKNKIDGILLFFIKPIRLQISLSYHFSKRVSIIDVSLRICCVSAGDCLLLEGSTVCSARPGMPRGAADTGIASPGQNHRKSGRYGG